MVLTIKHKFTLYRRFEVDIWGFCFSSLECLKSERKKYIKSLSDLYLIRSPYLKFFYKLYYERARYRNFVNKRLVYRFHGPMFRRRRKKFNLRFISIRLTRLYFLTFQDYQFRSLFRRAAKLDGNFEVNYTRLLEGRLLAIIYRLNYTHNIFWILRFIKTKYNVFINYKPVNMVNYTVPLGQLIIINSKWWNLFDWNLKLRLKRKALLFNRPKFLFISYKCHFAYVMRPPYKKDIIYPFYIDVQRISGYY